MDRLIYTAMSGASQILDRQAVVANNLANASTTGFKAELSAFRAVPVNGAGLPTRSVTAETTPGVDFAEGPINQTGRSLDVAINGPGWLAVQTQDGGEAYTRDGNLQIDAAGVLRSGGRPVLSTNGQPIVLPLNSKVTIANDGTVSALSGGNPPNTVSQVATLKRVAQPSNGMVRGGDGLFRPPPGPNGASPGPLPNDKNVKVESGALEGSNVSATNAMVGMIDNARQFSMQMQMLNSANQNAQSADKLLNVS